MGESGVLRVGAGFVGGCEGVCLPVGCGGGFCDCAVGVLSGLEGAVLIAWVWLYGLGPVASRCVDCGSWLGGSAFLESVQVH